MIYDDDYESIDDIARGEGFFIDDDGNWRPLENADDFECEYYGLDQDEIALLNDEDDDDCDDDGFECENHETDLDAIEALFDFVDDDYVEEDE